MRIRSASDAVYTLVAWLPLLAIACGVAWVVMTGVFHLEQRSFGSEFFLGNSASTNALDPVGPSDADLLSDALASGDTGAMARAMAQVDARQEARAAAGSVR